MRAALEVPHYVLAFCKQAPVVRLGTAEQSEFQHTRPLKAERLGHALLNVEFSGSVESAVPGRFGCAGTTNFLQELT